MRIRRITALAEVAPEAWDALAGTQSPFLRHAFLESMERHDCLLPHGWQPCHLIAEDGGRLLGALPLYLKDNSNGEFVFDWSWAEAYERAGGRYYPKLVSAVPFTPSTGPRLLVDASLPEREAVARALVRAAVAQARALGLSSLHCLFPQAEDLRLLEAEGLAPRAGLQYHWHNAGYRDFQDFLDALNAKRRKEIRRERRQVTESGVQIELLTGASASAEHWAVFHEFYCSTFERKWGEPRFTLPFFQDVARRLPEQTLLLLAREGGRYVAGAFAMRGEDTLYGRHWGCNRFHRQLHFELCYYRTIEYCIEQGLRRLDAGAQGEHKLARGFLPVRTWSAHWLRDEGFGRAVADFLRRERQAVQAAERALAERSPYRQGPEGAA